MFLRRKRPHSPATDDTYASLRSAILELDPASVGLAPTSALPHVWGVVMETAFDTGVATLVCLADATTSLYTSTGGGVIGAGAYPDVAAATQRLLALAEQRLAAIPPMAGVAFPPPGRVILRVLTFGGAHGFDAAEDDLGHRRHELSDLFHAAHGVIGQLRLAEGGA